MGVSIAVVGASACRNGGERVPESFTKPRLGWERKRASRAPILATRTPMRAHGEHGTDACHLSCNACAACHLSCNACAACSLSCNAVTCPATLVPPLRQINSAALNDGHVKLSTYLDQETITSLLAAAESQASKRANAGNDDTMEYSSHAMMKKQAVRRATHRVVVPCCSGRLGVVKRSRSSLCLLLVQVKLFNVTPPNKRALSDAASTETTVSGFVRFQITRYGHEAGYPSCAPSVHADSGVARFCFIAMEFRITCVCVGVVVVVYC